MSRNPLIAMWDVHLWVDSYKCLFEKEQCDVSSWLKSEELMNFIKEKIWSIIIQIWDLWVNQDTIWNFLKEVCSEDFKVVWWNRDNYEALKSSPHYLWDFWTKEIWWEQISFLR